VKLAPNCTKLRIEFLAAVDEAMERMVRLAIVVQEPCLLLDRAEHRNVRREPTPLLRQATCPLVVPVENGL
jgi:hypothetical protein